MTQPFRPAEVFHVMEYVDEECKVRGWTPSDLARAMGGDLRKQLLGLDLLALQEPGVLLGADGAADLARAFGTDADFWLRTDALWQERQAESPRQP